MPDPRSGNDFVHSRKPHSTTAVWSILITGVAVISTGSILVRLAAAPSLFTVLVRCLVATSVLAPMAAHRRAIDKTRSTTSDKKWLIASGLCLGLHLWTFVASVQATSVATSLILVDSSPVWVLVLGALTRIERVDSRLIFSVALAFGGCLLLAASDRNSLHGSLIGDGLGILSSVAFSGYMLCGRFVRPRMSFERYAAGVYSVAAGALAIVAIISGQVFVRLPLVSYGWLLAMSFGSQVFGHTVLNWSLEYVSASKVSIAMLLEPVLAAGMAALWLGEALPRVLLIAGPLIAAGVVVASLDRETVGVRSASP